MSDLPEPLTPADCDLRGLEYMPLLGSHLFGSEFNARASDTEWRAGVTLWWVAWQQQPAASLPDDDIALCRFADLGRDMKTWRKIKAMALHGFVKCSDGRLYHPTLAKQAIIAWDKRVKERERKAKWRAERQSQDADVPRDKQPQERGQNADTDGDVRVDGNRRDGTGRDDIKKDDDDERARDFVSLTAELGRIAGVSQIAPSRLKADHDVVRGWLELGADPETDIIPIIRQTLMDATERIVSLKYFDNPIRQEIARREASANGYGRSDDDRKSRSGGHQRRDGFLNACYEAADRQAADPFADDDRRVQGAEGLG